MKNETINIKLILLNFLIWLPLLLFLLFIFGVSKVDAKSYKIRLYDLNDNQVVNQDNTNPTTYNNLISSVYINYTNGNQSSNKTTYFAMDTTIGIRTCLTDILTGKLECIPTLDFNKIYWYDTNGSTYDITDSCNITLTKTQTKTTTNNSKLTQWRAITTCTIQSSATLQGFLWNPKITYNLAAKPSYNLNKSAVSINSFDITQNQTEGDQIIANANQNADRIIAAIREQNQELYNQNEEIMQQNEELIKQQEAANSNLNEINDNLTDNSAPTDYSFFNDIGLSSDTPISNLILMPITLLSAINSGFSGSCSSVNLGSLLGHDLILPCIDIQSKLGSKLWSTIDGLISIFLLYEIALMLVGAFEDMTSLNDSYTNLIARHSSENVSYTPRHGGGN